MAANSLLPLASRSKGRRSGSFAIIPDSAATFPVALGLMLACTASQSHDTSATKGYTSSLCCSCGLDKKDSTYPPWRGSEKKETKKKKATRQLQLDLRASLSGAAPLLIGDLERRPPSPKRWSYQDVEVFEVDRLDIVYEVEMD